MILANKPRLRRILVRLVVPALFLLLFPWIAGILGPGAGASLLLLEVMGLLILLVGMPFFFWIMSESGYRVFIKPYVRARRIRRIRNARYLREAVERGRN